MNKWIYTKDNKWVNKWNKFILSDNSSSFIQSIYRIKSYEIYGMDWELLLLVDSEDNIQMGSANIVVKFLFFKLYVCSYGPTKKPDYVIEDENEFIQIFLERSKKLNSFVSQLTVPINLMIDESLKALNGRVFTNISNPKYLNLINLQPNGIWRTEDELINTFLPKGRRDVRASYRKGLYSKFAINEIELQNAYSCFEDNAKNKGYYVRTWPDMKEFIVQSVNNKMAFVITAWFENKLQGTVLLERSSNKLSYTMGGVYRNTPDLLTGYFLQLEAMRLAIKLNIPFYDISYGGPVEVQRFKNMFNPILLENCKTVYFVNSSIKFFIYNKFYKVFKKFIPKIVLLKKIFFS